MRATGGERPHHGGADPTRTAGDEGSTPGKGLFSGAHRRDAGGVGEISHDVPLIARSLHEQVGERRGAIGARLAPMNRAGSVLLGGGLEAVLARVHGVDLAQRNSLGFLEGDHGDHRDRAGDHDVDRDGHPGVVFLQ